MHSLIAAYILSVIDSLISTSRQYFCEPSSVFTDFVLALFCIYCYRKLRVYKVNQLVKYKWSLFFIAICMSFALGCVSHTISCNPDKTLYYLVWCTMQFLAGLSTYFALTATIESEITSSAVKKLLRNVALGQLILLTVLIPLLLDFKVVAIYSAIAIIELLAILLSNTLKRSYYNLMLTSAFAIAIFSVLINRLKIEYQPFLDKNDLSHIVMFCSLVIMYRGIKQVGSKE